MFELIRLFPRRPMAVSIASWMVFFVLQIVVLTLAAYGRYVPPPEPQLLDPVWFVYTELPRALPMAAVYAVCMVFLAQVAGRFVTNNNPDNLTIGQWREVLREHPARAIKWMGLRLAFLFAVAGLIFGSQVPFPFWVDPVLAALAGLLFVALVLPPWLDWVIEAVTSSDGREIGISTPRTPGTPESEREKKNDL